MAVVTVERKERKRRTKYAVVFLPVNKVCYVHNSIAFIVSTIADNPEPISFQPNAMHRSKINKHKILSHQDQPKNLHIYQLPPCLGHGFASPPSDPCVSESARVCVLSVCMYVTGPSMHTYTPSPRKHDKSPTKNINSWQNDRGFPKKDD
jgi:hypothetical protein